MDGVKRKKLSPFRTREPQVPEIRNLDTRGLYNRTHETLNRVQGRLPDLAPLVRGDEE